MDLGRKARDVAGVGRSERRIVFSIIRDSIKETVAMDTALSWIWRAHLLAATFRARRESLAEFMRWQQQQQQQQ